MLAPARSRCRRCVRGGWLSAGLLGSDASVYALLMGGGFWVGVRCRSGDGGWVAGGGSAGWVLRSQGSSREHGLSRCARGVSVIASNARSGPIPLPSGTIRLSIGVWRDWGGGPAGGGVESVATTLHTRAAFRNEIYKQSLWEGLPLSPCQSSDSSENDECRN